MLENPTNAFITNPINFTDNKKFACLFKFHLNVSSFLFLFFFYYDYNLEMAWTC